MLIKINRQDAINKYPGLPLRFYDPKEEEYNFQYPKVFAVHTLTLPSKSYKGHIKLLATELVKLVAGFNCDNVTFLGDEQSAWLRRLGANKFSEEAFQYLVDNKVGKRFNGALQVDLLQLPTFITNLAWLIRSNGIVPYIHFVDPGQNMIGNICQYGNLHIMTSTKKADKVFNELIAGSKFEFLIGTMCSDNFSKSRKIKGRQLTV